MGRIALATFRKPSPAETERAKLAGAARAAAPRFTAASYDEVRGRLCLEFDRGFALVVSLTMLPGFEHASADDLRDIEILASGDAVYFRHIDHSLSASSLLADLTGALYDVPKSRAALGDQRPIRVQGGYLVGTTEKPPPPRPRGGSSFRSAK